MADSDQPDQRGSDTEDELRTIGFRLREIQRLLGIRVEQENRRLEAEGAEPVSETEFFRAEEGDQDA